MTELERAGYVKRRRYQDTLGRWKYDIDVFDSPVCNPVDNVDKLKPPHRDKPHGDNADVLVKTEQVKTMRELASSEIPMPRLCGQCHGIGKTGVFGPSVCSRPMNCCCSYSRAMMPSVAVGMNFMSTEG